MLKVDLVGQQLEVVEKMRLLGVTIRSDLKRSNNASDFVQRAANKDMALKKT